MKLIIFTIMIISWPARLKTPTRTCVDVCSSCKFVASCMMQPQCVSALVCVSVRLRRIVLNVCSHHDASAQCMCTYVCLHARQLLVCRCGQQRKPADLCTRLHVVVAGPGFGCSALIVARAHHCHEGPSLSRGPIIVAKALAMT